MKTYLKLIHWFYNLSWKKLMGAAGLILVVAVLPTALMVAQNPTRTRSEAALLPQPQAVTNEFEEPSGPPEIYLVDHFFGKIGDAVLIHGNNLGGLSDDSYLSLAGEVINPEYLVSWTGSYIEFKVPDGAKSGKVEVSVLGRKTSFAGTFFVVNDSTEGELRLVDGALRATEITQGKEMLVWLLVVSGEGQVRLSPATGVALEASSFELPIGRVYQVKLKLDKQLAENSRSNLVELMKVEKSEEMLVGVARAELTDREGNLIPLKVHPLYVSF